MNSKEKTDTKHKIFRHNKIMKSTANYQYVTLADQIQDNIINGVFTPGERLPSLRKLHRRLGLSISTIHQAYIELEKRGRVEAREKSGFYVTSLDQGPRPRPKPAKANPAPHPVKVNRLAHTIVSQLRDPEILQLGAAVCSSEFMPLKQLSRIQKSIAARELQDQLSNYNHPLGNEELRAALAKRMLGLSCTVSPQEIITAAGCLDAVALCLRAVTQPGDTVLVESPVFHSFLQLMEDLKLMVVELPGCPENGISPRDFEQALNTHPVKVCLLNSNFHNPLGSVLPAPARARIFELAQAHDIAIIEDDIYGDLFFGTKRPATFKSLDTDGRVLYCASVSKTLAPGLRTGWILPGRYKDQVARIKLNTTISSPDFHQVVTARFMETGAYDRHLRRFRNQMKNQASALGMALARHFPPGVRFTFPKGGMFIWIALDKKISAMAVFQQAYREKISILPGTICSSTGLYDHCLRLNCGIKWSPRLEQGIETLGDIVTRLYREHGLI